MYLHAVVHGDSKVGKTWLASTSPKPLLNLDAEAGGMRFVPGRKIFWNPLTESVPEAGDWDICQVTANNLITIETAKTYLSKGNHPFASISIDSLSEIQSRYKRELDTTGDLDFRDWGKILTKLEDLVMQYRDLVEAQEQIKSLVIVTGTQLQQIGGESTNRYAPMLQGRISNILPYKLDVCGFLEVATNENGKLERRLTIGPSRRAISGNRLGGCLPNVLKGSEVNISKMLEILDKNLAELESK